MLIGLFFENIRISVNSIKANAVRTVLTIIIIAFGIMALIGILTAIESIKSTISKEFQSFGANTFSIRGAQSGGQSRGAAPVSISFREAGQFKSEYKIPSFIGIFIQSQGRVVVTHKNNKTEPNITVRGINEDYLFTSGNEIALGRNFSEAEILSGDNIIIIGAEIYSTLFDEGENPIDKVINVGHRPFRIIGVLSERGTGMGTTDDRSCLVGINSLRQNFPNNNNFNIHVMPHDPLLLDFAVSEAEGVFKSVRNLNVFQENNFRITKSDSLIAMLIDNIRIVTIGASIIGIITLIGAAIGLMNIMLVSVAERTREIGIRKAIGAKSKTIKQQFLFESVFIGQIGGVLGIVLGIIAGNVVGFITGGTFIIPYFWLLFGIGLCFAVGIAAGIIPAIKASKLDPIVALRYE